MFKVACKDFVTRVGARMSHPRLMQIQTFVNRFHLGHWMRRHGFVFHARCANREDVWRQMVACAGQRQVLYLEFGVAAGESIRWWSRALKDPRAVFHGFDSFQGLPENCGPWFKGQFDTQGRIPVIDDPRVQFFKGWFDQTLPPYSLPARDLLIVNMDADLFNSTIYALRYLEPALRPGDLLYFDEMDCIDHEPRALDEFLKQSKVRLKPVAADHTLVHVCFEVA